jgi:hypothetical protein
MCSSSGDSINTSTGARDDGGSPCPLLGQLPLPLRGSDAPGAMLMPLLPPPLMSAPDPMLGHRNVPCGLQMRKLLFLVVLFSPSWTTVTSARWLVRSLPPPLPIACFPSLRATATCSIPIFSVSPLFANTNCSCEFSQKEAAISAFHEQTQTGQSALILSKRVLLRTFKDKKELEREAICSSSLSFFSTTNSNLS